MNKKAKIILKWEKKSLYERYKDGEFDKIIQNQGCSIADEHEKSFFMGYLVANAINRGEIKFEEQ